MRKAIVILSLAAAAAGAVFLLFRIDRALHVATAVVSHDLCSAVFVSGLDPAEVFAQSLAPRGGLNLIDRLIRYHVDRAGRSVNTTVLGAFESRTLYRDRLGCLVLHGGEPPGTAAPQTGGDAAPAPRLLPEIAPPALVVPTDARLAAALDHAFAETDRPPHVWTKAVVVAHDGRIIAERYAAGYPPDAPLLGFSLSKSVINALLGMLVRQGRLAIGQAAPIPAWQSAGDPRHAITVEHLMRMNSGLDLDETGTFLYPDATDRMLYVEPDMAAFAASAKLKAPPGTRWAYSSASTHLLARIVRDAVGGHADDVLRFARRELFEPLGMRTVTMEFDATGTPIGSHYMLASARDWARFGLLYANDGVVGGRRLLPEGWVRYSASPTPGGTLPGSPLVYGAGFWRVQGRDVFLALGHLGQRIAILPADRLVIVRLGISHQATPEVRGMLTLIDEVRAALAGARAAR